MKKTLLLALLLAAPAAAKQYPSLLSVGIEGGMSWGSLPGHGQSRVFGGKVKYDATPRWAGAVRLTSRTYKLESDASQRSMIQSLSGVAYYTLREPIGPWSPYGFAELGMSHNRSKVFFKERATHKPML